MASRPSQVWAGGKPLASQSQAGEPQKREEEGSGALDRVSFPRTSRGFMPHVASDGADIVSGDPVSQHHSGVPMCLQGGGEAGFTFKAVWSWVH